MKKFLTLIAIVAAVTIAPGNTVTAQTQPSYTMPVFRTITGRALANTDTLAIPFNSVGSNVMSLQITVVKNSGTVAGTVYLYATDDGIGYFKLDSLALTNVATPQILKYVPTSTSFKSYRANFLTAGTQNYTPYFSIVRRPDETAR